MQDLALRQIYLATKGLALDFWFIGKLEYSVCGFLVHREAPTEIFFVIRIFVVLFWLQLDFKFLWLIFVLGGFNWKLSLLFCHLLSWLFNNEFELLLAELVFWSILVTTNRLYLVCFVHSVPKVIFFFELCFIADKCSQISDVGKLLFRQFDKCF